VRSAIEREGIGTVCADACGTVGHAKVQALVQCGCCSPSEVMWIVDGSVSSQIANRDDELSPR
jgi:hypothetical protein